MTPKITIFVGFVGVYVGGGGGKEVMWTREFTCGVLLSVLYYLPIFLYAPLILPPTPTPIHTPTLTHTHTQKCILFQ